MTFDEATHTYRADDGLVVPSITQMLKMAGHVDERFFTEASRERGQAVHAAVAAHDMGVLDFDALEDTYRPYVLAYIDMAKSLRAKWAHVEEPFVHPVYRFGGRPDRVGEVYRLLTVAEVKSAVKSKAHQYQTALQAILVADPLGLPPERYQRLVFYLKPNGRFSVETHREPSDFTEAYRIIRQCCRGVAA